MSKKKTVIIFGGQSSEHEVSCVSAVTVINNLDTEMYEPLLIGITKDGAWKLVDSATAIQDGSWKEGKVTAVISPDSNQKAVLLIKGNEVEIVKIDVVFPVMHGQYGEDGTLQGLLELAGIPYVGCGVLASAVSMDKLYTKQIVERLGIRQARCLSVFQRDLTAWGLAENRVISEEAQNFAAQVEKELKYPVFVKPSNAGSSCGVSKAHDKEELFAALLEAVKFDRKILVEEAIVGRELECAVLGGEEVKASGIGEILAAAEFYDYDAKYNNEDSKTVISPDLPAGKAEEIAEDAVKIFRALDGFGLSRVDFFMENGTNEIVFNEINTLPGFTSISMYPMLWEAKGIAKKELVSKLLELAYLR